MIQIPTIAGVPETLRFPTADALAARAALAIAPHGPIGKGRRTMALEHEVLIRAGNAWVERAAAALQSFHPIIHVTLGAAIPCACTADTEEPVTVWLGQGHGMEPWGPRWRLDRRWAALERAAPGLAPTALAILEQTQYAAAAPLLTPSKALGMAQWTYWMGEADETAVLAENMDTEEEEATTPPPNTEALCQRYGIVSRAQIDKAMPREVTEARRKLTLGELERLAPRKDLAGQVAAAALACLEIRAARKAYALHTEQVENWAVGQAAVVRWSPRDPIGRIFDDHAQRIYEDSSSIEEFWGWFVLKKPEDLPRLFRQLERQFTYMRAMEKLLALIAERTKA